MEQPRSSEMGRPLWFRKGCQPSRGSYLRRACHHRSAREAEPGARRHSEQALIVHCTCSFKSIVGRGQKQIRDAVEQERMRLWDSQSPAKKKADGARARHSEADRRCHACQRDFPSLPSRSCSLAFSISIAASFRAPALLIRIHSTWSENCI